MRDLAGALGVALIVAVLVDAFETVVLPRRLNRRYRFTVAVYRGTWPLFAVLAARVRSPARREKLLSYYGPASLLFLFICWAALLVIGYAAAVFAFAGPFTRASGNAFGTALYVTASSFFTLGFGNIGLRPTPGRILTVATGATGFAFLALVIGYLPTLYQAFSRREVHISQLDARAGSPPTAGEMLARSGVAGMDTLATFLADWETWSADLLESLLSYPVLGYYRSHHDSQSWLAALAVVLDTCSVLLVADEEGPRRQARLTYAMCRHAAVDLAQVLYAKPLEGPERLDAAATERLRSRLAEGGWHLPTSSLSQLAKLREAYEPYLLGLSHRLQFPLPGWTATEGTYDSWRITELDSHGRRPSERRPVRRAVRRVRR